MKAAIDIGSNSIRCLLLDNNGKLAAQAVVETRLGEGFDCGRLTEAAMERTLAVLTDFRKSLIEQGAAEIVAFATSAVRDAANGGEFCQQAAALGLPVRVLSGADEARLGFLGAVGGFDFPPADCLLIDIGGGSTELAWYDGAVRGVSVPMGAVRYKVAGAGREEVSALLARAVSLLPAVPPRIIGVGGTITTAAAVEKQVAEYSRDRIHGMVLSRTTLAKLTERLAALTLAERRRVTGLPPARADIILYGLDILLLLLEQLHSEEITVSDHGILDGILEAQDETH